MNEYPNTVIEYILTQIGHFTEESKRLGTPTPLKQYKEIIDAFETIQKTLGTLQHEVALDTAKNEFRHARREALTGVGETWRNF